MKQMICSSRDLGDLTGAKEAEAVLDSFNENFLAFELQLSFSENVCSDLHGLSGWWKQRVFLCYMDGVYGYARRWICLNKSATSLLQNLDGLQFSLFPDFLEMAKLSAMSRSDKCLFFQPCNGVTSCSGIRAQARLWLESNLNSHLLAQCQVFSWRVWDSSVRALGSSKNSCCLSVFPGSSTEAATEE